MLFRSRSPVFSVSADQVEVGRILARQAVALLPRGGSALYMQGPSVSSVSRERHEGLTELLPGNIHLTALRGKWTEESATQSVHSWLKLMSTQKVRVDLILAQNDVMGMGARKAIEEAVTDLERDDWSDVPILGVDGVPKTGQAWVRSGKLAATVIVPPSAGKALTLMTRALHEKKSVPEHTYTVPVPFPEMVNLAPRKPGP